MKTRLIIIITFLLASLASLYFVFFEKISPESSGVLANLGTGFIGTAITVLIVDWLYERRSADDECRSIALSILIEFDHAVWVWQGGSRGLNVDELYSLLQKIEKDDPLPYFTQNLLMRLGSKCVTHLNVKKDVVMRKTDLFKALENLSSLELIRDMSNELVFLEFQKLLISSTLLLSSACAIRAPRVTDLPIGAHRESSEEHQHYRHFGRQLDGTEQPFRFS
jgi:hypothetical protein